MKTSIILWSFAVGAATGAIVASVKWSRMCSQTITAAVLAREKEVVLNYYRSECALAAAQRGRSERDPERMQEVNLLNGAYQTARYWEEDAEGDGEGTYDLMSKHIARALGLNRPREFAELDLLERSTVFVDSEGNLREERVDLVVRFLAECW